MINSDKHKFTYLPAEDISDLVLNLGSLVTTLNRTFCLRYQIQVTLYVTFCSRLVEHYYSGTHLEFYLGGGG